MSGQRWHLIEGEAGCRFAVDHGAVAIIVDSLRASATATMILHEGATAILAVREVDEARSVKAELPEALLFGERGGVPPEDFDGGNSPQEVARTKGKTVIFTTTTGAGRLVSAWGSAAVYMGTTLNARAVMKVAKHHNKDVVVIPAGLSSDPDFDAQEDRVASVAIALEHGSIDGEGQSMFNEYRTRIEAEGVGALFDSAPHAAKLRKVNMESDIAYCAQMNTTTVVPVGVRRHPLGVWLERA